MKFKDFVFIIIIVGACLFVYDRKKAADAENEILQVSQEEKTYISPEEKKAEENPDSIKNLVMEFMGKEDGSKDDESLDSDEIEGIISEALEGTDISGKSRKILSGNLKQITEILLKEKIINPDDEKAKEKFESVLKDILSSEKARELLERKSLNIKDKDKDIDIDLDKLKDSVKSGADMSYNIIKELIN